MTTSTNTSIIDDGTTVNENNRVVRSDSNPNRTRAKQHHVRSLTRLTQVFVPKLVLEVFGAGGAIWGFSEALGLRTSRTQEEWRCAALSVGLVFLVRFLCQVKEYCFKSMQQCQQEQHQQREEELYIDNSLTILGKNDLTLEETHSQNPKESQPLVVASELSILGKEKA